ncbi:uncharacterized protein LOC143469690 [Clavelina lepadiformis]|uniref:uncharacterized protein LOC143469690 n=1 Tax=Clavelina lepadiformis TaxID=159417 RepID=UPI004041C24A
MNPPEESNESILNLIKMFFEPNQKTKVSTLLEVKCQELGLNRRKFQRMILTNSILIRKMRSKDGSGRIKAKILLKTKENPRHNLLRQAPFIITKCIWAKHLIIDVDVESFSLSDKVSVKSLFMRSS